jgi:hypothetical protein
MPLRECRRTRPSRPHVHRPASRSTQRREEHYVFLAGCACPFRYIIRTEADGAHMKRYGELEAIEAAYEEWPGEEFVIEVEHGTIFFKEK